MHYKKEKRSLRAIDPARFNPLTLDRDEAIHRFHPAGRSFDYQQRWSRDRRKFKLAVKARQIGITTTEAVTVLVDAMMWLESKDKPNPPVTAFCSPSQRQSQRLMQYIQRTKNRIEKALKTKLIFLKEREDLIILDNYAEIWSLPNNPRTIEGLDLSKGVIDEVGNFTGREDQEVYDAMMGSLAATNGSLAIFGKPRGRRGLFWKLADPAGDYYKTFGVHKFDYTVRAKHDLTYLRAVEQHRKRMSSLAFSENYLCAFVDEGIVIFPWELLDRSSLEIELWSMAQAPPRQNLVYMGIDFGKKQSRTELMVVDHQGQKTYLRFNLTLSGEFEAQKEAICKSIEHFNPTKCLIDNTGLGISLGDFLIKKYASRIEPVQFSAQAKEKMILTTHNLLEAGALVLPKAKLFDELRDQLHGMEREVLESGKIRYTGKRSETDWLDDKAWALFLACSQLGEGEFQLTIASTGGVKKPVSADEAFSKDLDEDGNPN